MLCWAYLNLVFLAICALGDVKSEECGPSNKCICANSIMDCRTLELNAFPQTITKEIKAVYLNNNRITDLKQIPEESELQTLVLTNNKIKTLEYDTFDNLDNLKTLYLSNNSIKVIADDIFEWNPLKLEVLYLDSNELEFIQHFLFYDLEELTDLYLQHNKIVFIHPHAFLQLKSLRNLRLDGNKLHTFNHRWIDKLQKNMFTQLRFDNNPWSCDCAMSHSFAWLDKEKKSKWFHDITTEHALTCETPTEFNKKSFKELDKTKAKTHCDMPRIDGISRPSILKYTQNVKLRCVVQEGRYPVPTISWTAPNHDVYRLNTAINFDGIQVDIDGSLLISNLSKIDEGNYTCNASNTKGYHTATTKITLDGTAGSPSKSHYITESTTKPNANLTAVAQKACPSACQCISRHIDCSGDGSSGKSLTDVPHEDIPTDAITISLAGNEITSIRKSDFDKFLDLEELRMDDNVVNNIHSNALNALSKLTTLTLQQNKLTAIHDHTFSNLTRLNVLVLDRNQLTTLSKEMFKGLKALKWLYVRHNDITTLNVDAFDYLTEIKFIHLESNKLLSLPDAPFPPVDTLKSLTKIFVDDNNFQCDHRMERIRNLIRDTQFKKSHQDFFGDGIICSSPPDMFEKNLETIKTELKQEEDNTVASPSKAPAPAPTSGNYSGLLFGGIAVGVVLTFVILVLWRKYGRTVRTKGKSYNYSDLRGNDDNERNGLTENMGGQEAFV